MNADIRQKFVVGNWKMHTTAVQARQLAQGVIDSVGSDDHLTVIVCSPFPYLAMVADILKCSQVALGAQNMYPEAEGAFTGEVSPTMSLDIGCSYVILGHSERRHTLGESDRFINQKVVCALAAGLNVILCVGETLEERTSQRTERALDRQLSCGLTGIPAEALLRLGIAYEPVWAIGNDEHHATAEQAQEAHLLIRRKLAQIYGEAWATRITVQYGGSVVPANAAAFLAESEIDGVLIGGASLNAREFLQIITAAKCAPRAVMLPA